LSSGSSDFLPARQKAAGAINWHPGISVSCGFTSDAAYLGRGVWKASGFTRTAARGSQFITDAWTVYLDSNSEGLIYPSGNHKSVGDPHRVPKMGLD
jgi:hypothetical protein